MDDDRPTGRQRVNFVRTTLKIQESGPEDACLCLHGRRGRKPFVVPVRTLVQSVLPHATILVWLVLIGHLIGRHWRSSAVLAVAGFVGVWSWTNALQFQKSTALHPADAPVISAGFANLGISKAPRLGLLMRSKTGPERTALISSVWWSAPPARWSTSARGRNGTRCMRNLKTTRPTASRCSACIPFGRSRSHERPTQDWTISAAVVDAPGGTFQVELTHPCPPVPGWLYQRQAELNQLSTASTSSNWPVLVLGDLNETPFGAGWRELLKTSGLSPIGPLSTPTWPSQLKGIPVPQWLGIRIDHMLVGPEWETGPLEVGPKVTSDHRPIRATVWLQGSNESEIPL